MQSITTPIKLSRINLLLYSLLLIATPFLFLQNYLQNAIGELTRWSVAIVGIRLPVIFSLFVMGLLAISIVYRRQFTRKKAISWAVVVVMLAIGQHLSDHYLDIEFYSLQNNWHYFAYGIFAYLARQLPTKKNHSPARVIIKTFLLAMAISGFDEMVQFFISNRVFDISDIAKDLWGVSMGLFVVNFILCKPEEAIAITKIRQPKLRGYLDAPFSSLAIIFIFSFIFLFISSLLSDARYAFKAILLSLLVFLIVLFIIQKTNTKRNRTVALIIGIALVVAQITAFAFSYSKNIIFDTNGLVVYKGAPIPYFDFLIRENGSIKLMDKKEFFNQTDIRFLMKQASNILVIGIDKEETYRIGFPESLSSQFIFNLTYNRATQVICLPTKEACSTFNRLKSENKKVALLVHNTGNLQLDDQTNQK